MFSWQKPIVLASVLACASITQGQAPPPRILDNPVPPKVTLPVPKTSSADTVSHPLSADDAARIALRLSPMLHVAMANIEAAKGRTQQTKAANEPTIGLSLSYTHVNDLQGSGSSVTGVPGVGGVPAGFQTGLTIRKLLFDFNHVHDLIHQSEALEQVAELNLSRAQHDVVWQVKVAYYQFNGAKKLVTVFDDNVANRQRQRDLAQARFKSGLGLPSDVVTAESALGDAILGMQNAHNSMNLARVNMLTLMGVDARTPVELVDSREEPIKTDDLEALVTTALKLRPEILSSLASLKAEMSGLRAAKSSNKPTITGLLGAIGRGTDNPFTNDNSGIGFTLSFTPFDGGLTRGRVREAQANTQIAQSELEASKLQVITDISQAYLTLMTALQQVATAAISMSNAREGVRIAEGRYRSGLGLFLDIINAQAVLLNTTISQATALSQVKQSTAALYRAIGGSVPGLK